MDGTGGQSDHYTVQMIDAPQYIDPC